MAPPNVANGAIERGYRGLRVGNANVGGTALHGSILIRIVEKSVARVPTWTKLR